MRFLLLVFVLLAEPCCVPRCGLCQVHAPVVDLGGITLSPLECEIDFLSDGGPLPAVPVLDVLFSIVEATVRVTVDGVCGSGLIVARDQDDRAIVITNAHVAGSVRGRVVNVERWSVRGVSEKGTGVIISAGYGRGLSIDFAVLRCSAGFGLGVRPIPFADRQPSASAPLVTMGAPRCEWPSLQILRLLRGNSQILAWRPLAIGGRSGSGVVDLTDVGPRCVGLLTWAGNGEGLGQSAPFLLSAMRGRFPVAIEELPPGVVEVPFVERR